LKRVAIPVDGGVVVAHRAFHHWKRPAQRAVAASSIAAPHTAKVARHAEMRFLRFQAPWTCGRKVFALLRRAQADNWVNIRDRVMEMSEKRVRTRSWTGRLSPNNST